MRETVIERVIVYKKKNLKNILILGHQLWHFHMYSMYGWTAPVVISTIATVTVKWIRLDEKPLITTVNVQGSDLHSALSRSSKSRIFESELGVKFWILVLTNTTSSFALHFNSNSFSSDNPVPLPAQANR